MFDFLSRQHALFLHRSITPALMRTGYPAATFSRIDAADGTASFYFKNKPIKIVSCSFDSTTKQVILKGNEFNELLKL